MLRCDHCLQRPSLSIGHSRVPQKGINGHNDTNVAIKRGRRLARGDIAGATVVAVNLVCYPKYAGSIAHEQCATSVEYVALVL